VRPGVVVALVGSLTATSILPAFSYADEQQPPGDPRGPEPPVYVVMPPAPQAAPPSPDPPHAPPKEKFSDGGVELALGTLLFQPSLGHAYFDGAGTVLGADHRENFHHLGRELGVDTPVMWGGEISFHYMRRYFAIGVMGFVAGHPGSSSTPVPSHNLASLQVNPSALMGYGGGIEFDGALPLGPVSIRAGGVIGARGFSMPMIGFEETTCHDKHGSHPCYENATTNPQLFFEPRVRVEVSPDPHGGFFFGCYVGMGVVGGSAPTAGLFFGAHTPHATLLP